MTEPLQQGNRDSVRVEALQRRLVALGYKLGTIDGKFGSLTAGALLAFQHDSGLPTTGVLDATTEAALSVAEPRRLDEERIKATETDLLAKGSRITIDARRSRILSWIGSALGAFGLGNSAIVNAVNSTGGQPASLPDTLLPLLAEVQKLGPNTAPAELQRISDLAKTLFGQISGSSPLPADVLSLIDQLRQAIPPEVLAKNPGVAKALELIAGTNTTPTTGMTTILDILPTFFANDSVLQTIMKGVAAVGASVFPGFGGSLAVLGLGLAARFLANRIAAARVEDHQSGGNINPLAKEPGQ